ncbi:MAG TPA: AI-2E family transporter [Sphingomonas sp.]|nr:AI-2E family transporter [Sphingomonas sp.]
MTEAPRLRPGERDRLFLKRLFLALLVVALVVFLYKITDLLLLAFGSAVGAVLLSAVADWIAERTPLSRNIGFGVAILLLLGALWLIGWLFGDELSREFDQMMARLPGQWREAEATLSATPMGRWLVDAMNSAGRGKSLAVTLANWSLGAGEILVNFLIVLVGAIFFGAQPRLYRDGIVCLTPPPYRAIIGDALDDCGRTLKLWLLTQIVLMTTMGLLVGGGLWLAGLKSAAALGMLAALSEFIPYVGPTLAMLPPIVIAIAGEGSIGGVIATFVVVRFIQSSFITPMVERRVVSVPPAITLFVILAFGYAFGLFGLFFSAPLLVVAYTLVGRLYLREAIAEEIELPGEEAEEALQAERDS